MSGRLGDRSTIVDGPGGPEVHIRAPRHWGILLFLPVWIVGWTFGGIMAIRQMFTEPTPFLAVWLVGWLAGEVFTVVAWSWMAFGEEVLSVAQEVLTIARRVGPLQIRRCYALHECSSLRASGWFGLPMSFSDSLRLWGLTGGTIAVDCNGKPIRFGIGLEEAEANVIVKQLMPFIAGYNEMRRAKPPRLTMARSSPLISMSPHDPVRGSLPRKTAGVAGSLLDEAVDAASGPTARAFGIGYGKGPDGDRVAPQI
jgi:hypothetical protein